MLDGAPEPGHTPPVPKRKHASWKFGDYKLKWRRSIHDKKLFSMANSSKYRWVELQSFINLVTGGKSYLI